MRNGRQFRITSEMVFRAVTDIILINVCFISAFLIRYIWALSFPAVSVSAQQLFVHYSYDFIHSSLLLSLLSVIVFSVNGFYTKARAYQSKYKVLVVARAVSLAYVLFGFVMFIGNIVVNYPRSVVFIGWALTVSVMIFSRVWSTLWQKMISKANTPTDAANKKSVLVIGGAGYIGSALLPKLLDEGYHVRLLDLFLFGEEPIKKYVGHDNLTIIKADFRQIDEVVKAVRGVESVVHLGAIVGDPACSLDEELTIEVNLVATRMIAEVCKGVGVKRFVFASTCSVYGASDEFLNEQSKLNPVSLYARSKIACERVLQKMEDEHFSPIILRFSTIFGLSGRTRFDLVVNLLTAKAHFDKKITLFGGDQWRPFLHVDDAALSVVYALKAPISLVSNQIYNVGESSLNYTLAQVAEKIKAVIPDADILELGQGTDRRNYRVEFTKIQKEMHFKPMWSLDAGITQVITAIQRGEVLDYNDAKFSNAKFLEESRHEKINSRHIASVEDLLMEPVI